MAKMQVVVAIAKERGGRRLLRLYELRRVATFQAGRVDRAVVVSIVGHRKIPAQKAPGASGMHEMTLGAAIIRHRAVLAKLRFERSGFEIGWREPPLMRGLERLSMT